MLLFIVNTNLLLILIYHIISYNTYSMEHIPICEANRFSARKGILRILRNPKIQYFIHRCPSPVPIPRQIESVPTPTSHFLKIHINIIIPSMSVSPKWCLCLRFLHQNPLHASPLPNTRYMPRPSY
jgi:hypothetical protein